MESVVQSPHYSVVGAGIGGLTLAAALRQRQQSFTVFEQHRDTAALGAGIAMAPNALLALSKLNLAEQVAERGEIITRTRLLGDKGRSVLNEFDLSFLVRTYGLSPVAIHRKQLLDVLLGAAGKENVQYGFRCTQVSQDQLQVTCGFENGETAVCAALIGADGIHSVVSRAVAPQQELKYRGFMAWRGIVSNADGLVARGTTTQIWGPGTVFGFAPVSADTVYWYGTCLAAADFAHTAGKQDAIEHFADWSTPVRELIAATDEKAILCHAIFDHDPLPAWSKGRVCILGDAAHAMPPNMGQGGAQAVLDASALAERIVGAKDVLKAFREYQDTRIKAANSMVMKSRQAATMDHLRNPFLSLARDLSVRLIPRSLLEHYFRPDHHK